MSVLLSLFIKKTLFLHHNTNFERTSASLHDFTVSVFIENLYFVLKLGSLKNTVVMLGIFILDDLKFDKVSSVIFEESKL